jgi:hypothetical protein
MDHYDEVPRHHSYRWQRPAGHLADWAACNA